MKRFVTIGMPLMALLLVLALCGCGGQKEEPEESVETVTTETATTGTATTEAAQPSSEQTVDLVAIRDQIIAEYAVVDPLMIETEALQNLYGIASDQVVSSAGFSAQTGSAFPDEIVMIEAKDSVAADDIQTKLENHLEAIAEQAASYDPESEALAQKCVVIRSGNHVAMFYTTNHDAIAADFQEDIG